MNFSRSVFRLVAVSDRKIHLFEGAEHVLWRGMGDRLHNRRRRRTSPVILRLRLAARMNHRNAVADGSRVFRDRQWRRSWRSAGLARPEGADHGAGLLTVVTRPGKSAHHDLALGPLEDGVPPEVDNLLGIFRDGHEQIRPGRVFRALLVPLFPRVVGDVQQLRVPESAKLEVSRGPGVNLGDDRLGRLRGRLGLPGIHGACAGGEDDSVVNTLITFQR